MVQRRYVICTMTFLSEEQVKTIEKSRLFVFPTDTLPAFCARFSDIEGIDLIFQLKQRQTEKSLLLFLPNISWVSQFFSPSGKDLSIITKNMPGKITFVLPLKVGVQLPAPLQQSYQGKEYTGFRIPDHPIAQAILQITGPLAQTSLNISGATPITASTDIPFADQIDFIFPFSHHPQTPSTIFRLFESKLEILRQGVGQLQ